MSDNFTKAICILNNGISKRMRKVNVPYSRLVELFLVHLSKQGFIDSFFVSSNKQCIVYFKYINNFCLLKRIIRISRPSKRIFISYKDLRIKKRWQQLRHGVLSTSYGLMCTSDAYLIHKKGGELLVDVIT